MTPDREREAARICEAALDRPAAERAAFVAAECATDEALRREVESLLRQQSKADRFLQTPALNVAAEQVGPRSGLVVGQQIGPYQIRGLLGAGGMGEVYRARDTKLGRDVAIKMLPRLFVTDPERLSRFDREARMLASLSHSNIGAIYGLENVDGAPALVLELVEGDTLADRLAKGPLPIPDALKIASQIADALEAAHQRGIVHRDLKPANIVLHDLSVKVLDFGLAKALDGDAAGQDLSRSPTMMVGGTQAGIILGTAAYMSPEQARGQIVDTRTDVWAFGCVLYEMLTGRAPFAGATVSDIVSEVLKAEPDWRRLPARTPESVRRLLRRCLHKDPTRRISAIHDVRLDLEDAPDEATVSTGLATRAGRRERVAWVTALLLVGLVAIVGIVWVRSTRGSSAPQVRFDITSAPTRAPESLAISPDGTMIAFAATSEGRTQLWLHSMDTAAERPLADTDGGVRPFWKPDSRSVGFFADGKLKRIDVHGGTVLTIASAATGGGGTWNSDGTILFVPVAGSPILRVPESGGDTAAVGLDTEASLFPSFLPDGRHFLYSDNDPTPAIYVDRLDGSEKRRVVEGVTYAEYAASGSLLFIRDRTLFAQPFDLTRLELTGSPVQVAERVMAFSTARDGSLEYRSGAPAGTQLRWFDRSGKEIERVAESGSMRTPSISPDGLRAAVNRPAGVGLLQDIWVVDLARRVSERLTFGPRANNSPVWSPDGSRIVFSGAQGGGRPFALYETSATGGGNERLLFQTGQAIFANDWSPDGDVLLYRSTGAATGFDLWALSLKDKRTIPVLQTKFAEREAQFFPGGGWFAYQSNESGQFEIYMKPFPDFGRARIGPISTKGGTQVRWRRDGTELFYIGLDNSLMAVPMRVGSSGGAFNVGTPVRLFQTNATSQAVFLQQYDVSDDGTRFLITTTQEDTSPMTVILNWRLSS